MLVVMLAEHSVMRIVDGSGHVFVHLSKFSTCRGLCYVVFSKAAT